MKIALCSLGGSVGKTTIAAHMLHPRMPGAKIFAVDTTNMTAVNFGIEADAYSGDEFAKLYKSIVRSNGDLIIDVGGSKEGKEFLTGMEWIEGHDEIDVFLIPSMPDDKAQKAAVDTINILLNQGVDKSKIKVVFNGVKKSTVDEFDYLLGALTVKGIHYTLDATIFTNAAYDILSARGRSLSSMLNDSTDYKKIVRTTDDENELLIASDLMIAKQYAAKINGNLECVFQAIFPTKKGEKRPSKDKE